MTTTSRASDRSALRGAASAARASRVRGKRIERSRWRRQIRARPRLRGVYRVGVAVTGVAIMLIAISIGWLPGPGGLPLFLVGLAVLATEFVWAARLLWRANFEVRRLGRWWTRQTRWARGAMVSGLVLAICLAGWAALTLLRARG